MTGGIPVPFLYNIAEVERRIQEETDHEDEEEEGKVSFVPFSRWKGAIDTRVNNQDDERITRSGFCAIRSPEFPFSGADLGGRYNGVEIMCRSDGRPYSLNMRLESFIPDDVYQCFINIPPTIPPGNEICAETGGRFDKVVLLFQDFIVTSGGRMKVTHRELDNRVKVESIGFTLIDGVDGDFQFDLARIRAVNFDERGVIGNAD
jgi:hypothetical protein